MHLLNDMEFCALGVGAIIEKNINGGHYVLIQNRIRIDDVTQNQLIEVPCGKIRTNQKIYDILKYRVKEETGLIVTNIKGQDYVYSGHPDYSIQAGKPFYMCQNVEKRFPICILFYICEAESGTMKSNSDAATNIRWISIEELKEMLIAKQELFFPLVYEALKVYVHYKEYISL